MIVDKTWFTKYLDTFKHRALTIYCFIMKGYNYRQEVFCSVDYIKKMLNISNNNHTAQKYILDTLKAFESSGIFKCLTPVDKGNLIIYEMSNRIEKYVVLYDYEIDRILQSDVKLNKDKMLSVFLYIKGCINSKTKVAYPSIKTIKRYAHIGSEQSVVKYIKALRDLGLIQYRTAKIGVNVYKIHHPFQI